MILEIVINKMAVQSFLDTLSLNRSNAIKVVATISKLPSKEALAEEPILTPNMRKIGARISSSTMPIV